MPEIAIEVRNLHAHYGAAHVLHGMTFDVPKGEVVTLLGRNGAGKTTTLRALIGLQKQRSGSVRVGSTETIHSAPEAVSRLGVAYCPEERGIFASLTVRENLLLPPVLQPGGFSLEDVYSTFPRLAERSRSSGTKLSGGEQQMLAIARILRSGSRVLLLDEPTEGLAPVIVQQIGDLIHQLKQRSYTILLVEQNLDFALDVADRHYVVERGLVVDCVQRADATAAPEQLSKHLGV